MSEVMGDGQEELPRVQGQGQPRGDTPHPRSWATAGRSYPASKVGAAKRRHPASKVRGCREELPCIRGQWRLGGDTPRRRSGVAGRSHLAPEARGSDPEEPPRAQGQGPRPGGATQVVVAVQAQEGLEEVSHVEGQEPWR